MVDIFVSYSKKDALHARTLSEYLESKGWDVFWDHEIPPGSNWVEYIGQNLDHSKLVVVLWSESSTESKWVRREASIALDKENLLPVRLQDVIPPNIFSSIQSASLVGWDGITKTPDLEKLVGVIEKKIGKPQSDATHVVERPITKPLTTKQQASSHKEKPQQSSQQQTAQKQTPQPVASAKKNTGLLLALVGLAVLAIGGWFVFNQMQQKSSKALLQAESKYWSEVRESTQPQVFKDYLSKYGEEPGTFSSEARKKYDELIAANNDAALLEKEVDYWELVSSGDKMRGYKKYLKRYGEYPGTYTEQAKTRIAELDKEAASESLKIAEQEYWDTIKNENEIKKFQAYLEQYGANPGSYAGQAKNKIDTLKKQQSRKALLISEETLWKQIAGSGNPEEFQAYLKEYGTDPGTYTAEAKKRIESLTGELDRKKYLIEEKAFWEKIQTSTNPDDYKKYLRTYGKDPGTYKDRAETIYAKLTRPIKTQIRFVNKSGIPVVISRLTNDNREESAKGIQAGESHVQEVSPGEKWLVRDRRTKEELLKFTATEKTQQIDIPGPSVNGSNVALVKFGFKGQVLGAFKQADGKQWQEISRAGSGNTFNFTETGRDDWSVYLFDKTRRVKIQLDLYTRKIYFSDSQTPRREQYEIIDASKESEPAMWKLFGGGAR
jgi:hypothetical protein